jgi:hypothetical protein
MLSGLAAEGTLEIGVVQLPPLVIAGQPARAHTQGLEIVARAYYVTARREDVQPKRAMLLRTAPGRPDWVCWDITPEQEGRDPSDAVLLDHPGGLQAGGSRLWIPLAESRRGGRSVIRAYDLAELEPGQPARAAFEFGVDDHVGAVAICEAHGRLFGASWDTASVYCWDFEGRQRAVWSGAELAGLGLGIAPGPTGRPGLAVQDWKFVGDRLFASGLLRSSTADSRPVESWLLALPCGFRTAGEVRRVRLPERDRTNLAREGMAIADGVVHFLPEDLGATNRLFRVSLVGLDVRARTVFIPPVQR